MIEINRNPSRRELRQFAGIWFPGFFILVGGYLLWRTGSPVLAAAVWVPAFVVSLVGYAAPRFMRPIFVGWMIAAYPIGWVVSHTLMAVVFYLIVTPIGVLMRMLGFDPLERRFDRSAKTYWVPRGPAADTQRHFHQF